MQVATKARRKGVGRKKKKRVGYVAPTPSFFVTDAVNDDGFDGDEKNG